MTLVKGDIIRVKYKEVNDDKLVFKLPGLNK